jgi:hypothetical protein
VYRHAVGLLLLIVASRAGAAGFPFGTAHVVVDSVNAAVEVNSYSYDSGPVLDTVVVRMTVVSGNLQPSFDINSPGHGGGGLSQGIGPVTEIFGMFTVPSATYNVQIGATIGPYGSGTYRLYFQSFHDPQGATPIAYGQTLPGNLAEPGQLDTWIFQGEAGDQYQVQTTRTSGLVNPLPRAFNGSPNSGTLAQSVSCSGADPTDDSAQITFTCTLTETGTFVLIVGDTNDTGTPAIDPTETGGYTLALTCLDGPCTTATSSTTTSTTSTTVGGGSTTTTSTTLAVTTEQVVDGAHLVLTANASKPTKRKLLVVSKDPDVGLGAGNGSADDPRASGAQLRVTTAAGDGFDDTYDLAAVHWKTIGQPGQNKGYRYAFKSGAPIKAAVVKPKLVKIVANGAALAHTLAASPNPVQIVLTMGGVRYCASFGGTVKFKAGKSYDAKASAAPAGCP